MNPEIKAKWVEALRSGKYKQATEQLRDGDAYCCLGVLCDVMGLKPNYNDDRALWYFLDDYEALPAKIAWEAGIVGACGDLPAAVEFKEKNCTDLARLNDAGADFNFIADVIEKQL